MNEYQIITICILMPLALYCFFRCGLRKLILSKGKIKLKIIGNHRKTFGLTWHVIGTTFLLEMDILASLNIQPEQSIGDIHDH